MKKRLLHFAFVVITIICLAAITVSAETYTGACGDNIAWTLDTETGVLEIDGTGDMYDWSPYSLAPWYSYCGKIKFVNINSGVTSIGEYAFLNFTGITSIYIPNSITSICYQAFYNCSSLTSVVVPDGVTSIDSYAFSSCDDLTSVTIPKYVTNIGSNAFYGCSLLTIYGYTGSSAETYASDNDIPFVALDETSVPGDADGDGKVEAIDLIFFQRVLSNWIGYTIPNSADLDLDCDGVIKSIDAVILSRHLANWVGYETLPYVSCK